MIPKKLHYIWLGGGQKSPLIKSCIESWRTVMPDFEIVEWSESNFDVSENPYALSALKEKKWAFVSDYMRLKILSSHGGIYIDSDVEVYKSFDRFLEHKAFTGFEKYRGVYSPVTAVMGSVAHHPWILELLSEYDGLKFDTLETNTSRIRENLFNVHGIINNNVHQIFGDDVQIYPAEIFCEKTESSYAHHHFGGSWLPKRSKIMKRIRKSLNI